MPRFTFSGTEVLLGMLFLCLITGIGIYLLRRRLGRQSVRRSDAGFVRPDIFSYSSTVRGFSLCAALFLSFLSLNWTKGTLEPVYEATVIPEDEITVNVPLTLHRPPPPPPPPPPPVIEPVAEPDAPSVVQQDQSITEMDPVVFDAPIIPERSTVPPPPPPPPARDEPVLFVERMPVFGSECQQLIGAERKQCSDRALLRFVQSRIDYPEPARSNNIEGTVVVRFIVEKDGSVSNIEAVREVSGGCTQEAVAAVEAINGSGEKFTPGIQGGRPVRVVFNLPVKFQLQRK